MATEVDDTGTVTETSTDRCSVTVKIDGEEEALSFGKKNLFSFGIQCDGDMTNIIDAGMEVDLCYRLPKSGSKPILLAVWIGDKPDQDKLCSEEPEAVYLQEGQVDQVLDDTNYLVSCDDMLSTVFVRKDVVYRDGSLSSTLLSVGDRIIFDALSSEPILPSGAKYRATCAWTGNHPRLVDRFGLSVRETTKTEKVKLLQRKLIDGTVLVIPNDVVAFVNPDVEDVAEKVILFRSSFMDKRERMKDIVEVGEKLRMRLQFGIIFRGKRQWFAAKAWKEGEEIPADDQVDLDDKLEELESVAFNAQSSVESGLTEVSRRSPSPAQSSTKSSSAEVSLRAPSPAIAATNSANVPMQPAAGAGYPPVSYGDHGYPATRVGYPAFWYGHSNAGMYPVNTGVYAMNAGAYPVNAGGYPIVYSNSTPIPVGMIGVPVGRYGYPTYVTGNPVVYAQTPSHVSYPQVQAGVPGNTLVRNVPMPVNSAIVAQRSAIEPPAVTSKTDPPQVLVSKPDPRITVNGKILCNDPPLQGIITTKAVSKINTAWISDVSVGILIKIKIQNVYIYGRQCTKEQFATLVSPGKNLVFYEAMPSEGKPHKGMPTHEATCVWVGPKPTLVDLVSDMAKPNTSLLGMKDFTFFGQVMKICLPDKALVELVDKKSTVCVHIGAFGCKPKPVSEYSSGEGSIINFIKISTWLSFKIVSVAECPIVLTAIDVKILKGKKETMAAYALCKYPKSVSQSVTEVSGIESVSTHDEPSADSDSESKTCPNTLPSAGACEDDSCETVSNSEIVSSLKNLSFLQSELRTEAESSATTDSAYRGNIYQATVFKTHSKPQEMPTRFLNCSGKLQIEREDGLSIYKVQPASGFPSALLCTPKVLNFCRQFNNMFAEHDGLEVKFNAECKYSGDKVDFYINRIWWGCRISGVNMLYTELARDDESPKFEHNVPVRAVVTSITQHDAAVAEFDGIPVIIPFEALHLSEHCSKRNEFSSVDQFMKKGDCVILTDIKTMFYCSDLKSAKLYYYVAGSCWKEETIGHSQWDEIKIPEVQEDPSWLDRWLCGEFSRKERAVKRDGRYYVDFTSSKIDGLKLSLDVFEHSKFFDNGILKGFDSLKDLEDSEIKFHVAHRRDPQISDNMSEEFLVKYAWIGADPECLNVLKDELEVPDALVVDGCSYVAVIEDFVLPTHMICKIGVVPVVVPFPQVGEGMSESDFQAQTSTRCRSQVVIKVRETFYKGRTFLESDFVLKKETVFEDSDVLIACKGEVVVPPCPEGVIRTQVTTTDIRFHLCSVLPVKESCLSRNERFAWFRYLKNVIQAGTKVCFNAAKDNQKGLTNDYYAYEVWLDYV